MHVLIIGSGGREHALAWRLARSPSVTQLTAAPGSDAIARLATVESLALDNVAGLAELAWRSKADLVVIGPETPLAAGLADQIMARGIPVFGCSQAAATIEASKAFAKKLLLQAGVATAPAEIFTAPDLAERFIDESWDHGIEHLVVKADGLAAGKGVIICHGRAESRRVARRMLAGELVGQAGRCIVIEEFLVGREASCMALADGERCWMLAPCEDHKAVGDGDVGPMTGGMGAISPTPVITDALAAQVQREIMEPTLRALATVGRSFRGLLYAGLMVTDHGPRVLEFNCRLGDPEAQALLPRFSGDLAAALLAVATGHTPEIPAFLGATCSVVMAAAGYPGPYEKGAAIHGIEEAEAMENIMIFHAGTKRAGLGWAVSGGRVLNVTAWAGSPEEARERAYQACGKIHFAGAHLRHDIGARRAGAHLRHSIDGSTGS